MLVLNSRRIVILINAAINTPIGRQMLPIHVLVKIAQIFFKQRLSDICLQLQIFVARRDESTWNIVKAVEKEMRWDQMAQSEEKKEEGGSVGLGHGTEFGAVGDSGVLNGEKHDKLKDHQHVGSEERNRNQPELLSPHFNEV